MLVLVIDTATPYVTAGLVDVRSRNEVSARSCRRVRDARAHNEVLTPFIMECCEDAGVRPSDIDAVVGGVGPGPFTGLRVGMATAAAFGDALGIPVIGVCSLDGLAWNVVAGASGLGDECESCMGKHGGLAVGHHHVACEGDSIIVATDARRREVYWATYRVVGGRPVRITDPEVTRPADVIVPGQVPCCGVVCESVADSLVSSLSRGEETMSAEQMVEAEPDIVNLVRAACDRPTNVASHQAMGAPLPDTHGRDLFPPMSDLLPLTPLYLRRPDAVPPAPRPISPAIGEEAVTQARQVTRGMPIVEEKMSP
ncbi:tRNA (adenosine(37)-N6)-threonylcarbamoyltransferase complex dimerization subunit type 1 TsaB [Corynebacterium kroppenstedtii]|uniref:tRNA (adenosine(37)-N6)-threonylcarbamoyltransferase complex dimerization subunit type 1 TsaB n=1 Tax=Corynebacterium sp. PCR 32 TaxID=3351342 RepID=UPI00309D4090